MKYPGNIREVAAIHPDYMGFIFYPKSPRFVGDLDPTVVKQLPNTICKVGVFVNETIDNMLATAFKYHLNAIQLHGEEPPTTCETLRKEGLEIIKAFSIATTNDLNNTSLYQKGCDFLLFDTKTSLFGGSGKKYPWKILQSYTGRVPFFLSGGIGANDIARLQAFHHPLLHAVDVNSRFETAPGQKEVKALNDFINQLKY
ncbi:MAG: phosphoribosylanthranilate isomerase [Microbacter sp.]